jgi:hypothetical protein
MAAVLLSLARSYSALSAISAVKSFMTFPILAIVVTGEDIV